MSKLYWQAVHYGEPLPERYRTLSEAVKQLSHEHPFIIVRPCWAGFWEVFNAPGIDALEKVRTDRTDQLEPVE